MVSRFIAVAAACGLTALTADTALAQGGGTPSGQLVVPQAQSASDSAVRTLVSRLDLERYKTTIKGLTQFGDRRQGTDRNRAAVDWIEAQLKSYGCTNTERIKYEYWGRQLQNDSTRRVDSLAGRGRGAGAGRAGGGGRAGGAGVGGEATTTSDTLRARILAANQAIARRDSLVNVAVRAAAAAGQDTAEARRVAMLRAEVGANPLTGPGARAGGAGGRGGGGGGRGNQNPQKGFRAPTGVNTNPLLQPDTALRRINAQRDTPGPREQVYCTKIGTTRPNEMYIIGAHMDGHGFGSAANDDGSGTAIVMELARILHAPDVQTETSIRFILFNNEETGGGAAAYVQQRAPLQGIENPVGSRRYPEPKWLGMIQHDMMMWDHGMPGPDGKVSPEQRREADINVEFAGTSTMAGESQKLAWFFRTMNDRYATDYPAAVGDRMSNTDSRSFQDHVAAISLRENERLAHTGTGWNPTWHQPIDVFETFSDKDFRLGLNSAQTTLAAVASLSGATVRK
jgi:hypothetical protein